MNTVTLKHLLHHATQILALMKEIVPIALVDLMVSVLFKVLPENKKLMMIALNPLENVPPILIVQTVLNVSPQLEFAVMSAEFTPIVLLETTTLFATT